MYVERLSSLCRFLVDTQPPLPPLPTLPDATPNSNPNLSRSPGEEPECNCSRILVRRWFPKRDTSCGGITHGANAVGSQNVSSGWASGSHSAHSTATELSVRGEHSSRAFTSSRRGMGSEGEKRRPQLHRGLLVCAILHTVLFVVARGARRNPRACYI